MKKIVIVLLWGMLLFADTQKNEPVVVKISHDIPYITTVSSGQEIQVGRVQDTDNVLTDDFTKTSRECPPFCIQPTKISEGIQNIEELELLEFMKAKVSSLEGVVIDSRLKTWFELETIPSAVNIPYSAVKDASKEKIQKIFQILGMTVKEDGNWDFSEAKELAFFDNGVWCEQAKHFIDAFLKHNYPKEKLFYYRSGLQGWKLLSLTTVVHKEIVK